MSQFKADILLTITVFVVLLFAVKTGIRTALLVGIVCGYLGYLAGIYEHGDWQGYLHKKEEPDDF